MENQSSTNNNNNQMFRSTTQNVLSVASSSITPLKNHRLFNPRMNRLTAVKRLARKRRKTYPKYGPYPCQWCDETLPTSQHFASHMRSHYIDARIVLKGDKKAQEDEPQLSPAEAQEQKRANLALRHAKAELKKARKRTEELTLLLAQANAKAQAVAQAQAPPSRGSTRPPNSCVCVTAARAPAPVPALAPKDNTKLVVVKHEVFPAEYVKSPPWFQHLLAKGPDGRPFIIQKVKLEFDI